MSNFGSTEEILDFAIKGEEEAAAFYTELAGHVEKDWMKKALLSFAKEEEGHKAKLVAIKDGNKLIPAKQTVQDLKIGDYLVDVEAKPGMDYQDALIVAMKKEKAAFKLYSDLAEATQDKDLRAIFLALAQEEAKHKLRFEVEYDDVVLKEN
ncbi:MAG: ferritin family protein [bacterium]